MINVFRIAWVAVRELIYEKVFYLLLGFVVMAMFVSMLLGQLTYISQAKLTLDFMLGGMELSMILLAVFMGIRLFQQELTMGSVSMILTKPISRWTFLLGKYFGQLFMQALIIAAMAGVTVAFCLRVETTDLTAIPIFQSSFLIFLEVAVVMAITYCFAVNMGSVTTAICTLTVFALGHLRGSSGQQLSKHAKENFMAPLIKGIIPDLELFNTKALASYGMMISWDAFAWAVLYAVICIVFFLTVASATFSHKDVLT